MNQKATFRHGLKMSVRLEKKVIDGYAYICNQVSNHKVYVKCQQHKTKRCKSRGKIIRGELTLTHDHNHSAKNALNCQFEFEKALHSAVISQKSTELRIIYDRINVLHPVAAINSTWAVMQPKMQSWRAACRPPFPNNWQHYAEILRRPQWLGITNYQLGRLSVNTLQAVDGTCITTFANPQFLRRFTPDILFIDATFKVIPLRPKSHQLLTVLALKDDTVIPVYWALMGRKSNSAYAATLAYFHEVIAPHIYPTMIVTDFENSLVRPINTVYPEAMHKGCFFHFCQAIMKKLKKLRLINLIKNWRNGQILIRKFMALALLPAEVIRLTFDWLIQTLPDEIRIVFAEFIEYFNRQWMNRVGPDQLSMFGLMNRTNNYSEAYNRVLRLRLGTHSTIWDFTERLVKLASIVHIEYVSLQIGNAVRRGPRYHLRLHDEKFSKLCWLFNEGYIDNEQFLAYGSNLLQAFTDDEAEANNRINNLNIFPQHEDHPVFTELNLDDVVIIE